LGGGLKTPQNFAKAFDLGEKLKDGLRKLFYCCLTKNTAWRQYLFHAQRIIIGTDFFLEYLPYLPVKYQKEIAGKLKIIFDTNVDVKDYPEVTRANPKDYVQIVFVGRLIATKGILLLIDAVREIKLTRPEALAKIRVVVLGGGPLMKKAEGMVAAYGLKDRVHLIGRVNLQEVKRHLNESDIFCLPTIREPGGGAILEAMATGLPIITSDYGGPKFSVNGECGIKIAVDSYDQYVRDLAQAIITLAADDRLRAAMGAKARQRVVEELSVEALQRKLFAVYNEVIAGSSGAPLRL
jgi:glycosyltransferase involved in cell wall biosynthesis